MEYREKFEVAEKMAEGIELEYQNNHDKYLNMHKVAEEIFFKMEKPLNMIEYSGVLRRYVQNMLVGLGLNAPRYVEEAARLFPESKIFKELNQQYN